MLRQLNVLYGEQYSDAEKRQHIPAIHSNIIQAMKVLCDQAVAFNMQNQVQASSELAMIRALDENDAITVPIGNAIEALWSDVAIKAVWERRNEFQVIESVQYYFKKIDVIKMPDYLPGKDDILYLRVRISGIVTERYIIDGTTFEMYDVGGQRNERKKWIHCFEGVTAVIFVAATSEYDQKPFEDESTNRMVEALDLFEEICSYPYFAKTPIILILNKVDLFAEKIRTKNIRDVGVFSDYSGRDGDVKAGSDCFTAKFLAKNKNSERMIYPHFMSPTDIKNVRVVFDACRDIMHRENLRGLTE